ncbi:MAG: CHAT domain-containing protein, partial [Deltaproteobacteria bacterium]|nr:CHAT domain-containing protein [Deltaproteobacteria bacterium]
GVKLLKGKEVVAASLTELNAEELEGMVNRFRKPFDTAAFSDFDPKLARSLYEKLLEPVVNKVPSGAPIVVVPDGVMAMLPFEALVVKGEARWVEAPWGGYNVEGLTYFGDLHPISYAQSLTALALLDQKLKAGRKASSGVLIIADPVFSRADERVRDTKEPISPSSETQPTSPALLGPDKQGASDLEFTRLMETEKLADFLGELFQRDAAVYSGLKADKEIFLSDIAPALDRFRFVVFGTHGVYTTELPGIMEPILALTTWPPGKDGLLRMTEVMSLEMTAELVALTACQTGLGSQVSGEGIMSMGRAFLFAGAGSVLMTLWSVDETASVKLVEAFFRQMQGGQTATQALLAARSDLRRAGYDHPFFWGAFILVGLAD